MQRYKLTHHLNVDGHGPYVRQFVYRLDLIRHLIWRDYSLRYKHSALGLLWSLLLPLSQLLVLVFLFQAVVPLNIEAYPAFVFCAILPWGWFSSSLSSACGLFINNRDIVRYPHFAPASLALINTFSNLITFVVALPLLFIVLILYQRPITPALLILPLLIVIQSTFTAGLSLMIATWNVFYRDIQHIVLVILTLLFYLTPVFYRPQAVTEQYQIIYTLNPIAVLIKNYRAIFFEGSYPTMGSMLFISLTSIVMYVIGYAVYRRQQHDIIDKI